MKKEIVKSKEIVKPVAGVLLAVGVFSAAFVGLNQIVLNAQASEEVLVPIIEEVDYKANAQVVEDSEIEPTLSMNELPVEELEDAGDDCLDGIADLADGEFLDVDELDELELTAYDNIINRVKCLTEGHMRPTSYELSHEEIIEVVRLYLYEEQGIDIAEIPEIELSYMDLTNGGTQDGFHVTTDMGYLFDHEQRSFWTVIMFDGRYEEHELHPNDPILLFDQGGQPLPQRFLFNLMIDARTGEFTYLGDYRNTDFSAMRAGQFMELNDLTEDEVHDFVESMDD